MGTYAAAVVGCGLGSLLRFWLGTLRRPHHLPWPTLLANVVGTALLGAATALVDGGTLSAAGSIIVGGGIAGGLTTFSTLAVDVVVLWRASRQRAVAYAAVTVAAGFTAGLLGWHAAAALA